MPSAEYFSQLVNLNQQNDPKAKNNQRDQEMNIGDDGFCGSHQGHSFRSFQRCIKICPESPHSQRRRKTCDDAGTGSAFGIIPLA
jgi:hypothetical protein